MNTKNYRSRRKAKVLLNLLSDPAAIVDEKGNFLIVNDAFEEVTGLSRKELIESPFVKLNIFTAETKAVLLEHLKKRLQGTPVEPYEVCFTAKRGEDRCVEVKGKRVSFAGQPANLVVFHDVSLRKENARGLKEYSERMEALVEEKVKEIQEKEEKFRNLAEHSPNMIFICQKGKVVYANTEAEKGMGYSKEEFYSSEFNFLDLITPENRELVVSNFAKHTKGEDTAPYEYGLMTKDGRRIDAILNTKIITYNEELAILGIVTDITEREKVESSLKSSEEKFRNLAEQSPNMIFINQKGRIVYANREAEEATGYKKEEFYSPEFNFMDLIAPESKELAKSKFIKHMKGEIGHQYEYKLISKKGRTIDVINNQKVIDYNGEPAILGIVTDITESKRLKEKLEQYSRHLESLVKERTAKLEQAQAQLVKSERLAAIGELAGMVGHDLRNPLTGIKNAAYYLKKKGATCSERQAKEMLEIIDKAIDHSNKIINDLLDYSREMHLELTECAPRTLLNDAVRMIQVPDRIEIVNHVLEESRVRVDVDKMMRVFINLIKNAVDAMPEKGTLEITSHKTKDNLEIAFADKGMGIPDETLPKIFSPLFTTKAQGMGFGLAICKRIVESHGGTITVKTAVNKGTTFTITLPIKPKLEVRGEKTWINMPESLLSTTTRA
jgi:PAS domain S-box-containing protein